VTIHIGIGKPLGTDPHTVAEWPIVRFPRCLHGRVAVRADAAAVVSIITLISRSLLIPDFD